MFRRFGVGKGSVKVPIIISSSRRRRKLKLYLFILLTVMALLTASAALRFDERMFPTVMAMSENIARDKINMSVNYALKEVTERDNLRPEDFYTMSLDEQGMVNSLTVNTILVNEMCGALAVAVSEELYDFGPEIMKVPVGSILGVKIFSNIGPTYSIQVLPVGNALVDYETKFESVGINQTNFQIWLNIESTVKIVNPLRDEETTVTRKVSLINTVFSGKVPSTYLNNIPERKE